jgi:hypothetical protein
MIHPKKYASWQDAKRILSRTQELKNSRTQELKNSRTQELRNSGTQESRELGRHPAPRAWFFIFTLLSSLIIQNS